MEVQNYQNYEKFRENLRGLKKLAKRKNRQSFLRKLSKSLSHSQILTYIKFNPKLYLAADEIFNVTDKFENEDQEPLIEQNVLKLPNFDKKPERENTYFEHNNIDFIQHITIPVSPVCDLSFDASLFTKNDYIFSVFDVYASYTVSDIRIKVFNISFILKWRLY